MEKQQKIVKINENISKDLDFISKKMELSKSTIIEEQMKEFIKAVNSGSIEKQPESKAVGVNISEEVFEEYKLKCKEINYGVGEALDILLNEFNMKNFKRLEEEADVVYEEAIMSLFKGATNNSYSAVELIKLKEIIQELEKAVNKINSTGKVITTILVKYA